MTSAHISVHHIGVIFAEKYAGKKMPDRNVCQAPET